MTRITPPNTFNTANTHRIVLFQADPARGDFERLEELVADGLKAVRDALALMDGLPGDIAVALQPAERALRQALEKRRLLTSDCRNAIRRWLGAADRWRERHEDERDLDTISLMLRDAELTADRVLDLLAAEKEVGWQRGIGL